MPAWRARVNRLFGDVAPAARARYTTCVLGLVMAFVVLGGPTAKDPQDAMILITTQNLRSARGHVTCTLFNSATGFPGPSPLPRGEVRAKAAISSATCIFDHLPAGEYAVLVYHDENDNGLFDRNQFGIPTEGYGASNNVLPPLSPPTFKASHFKLEVSQRKALSVMLRY